LNDAEVEYTECTKFDTSKVGQERIKEKFEALFLKLCSNVANLASDEITNIALIAAVMKVALDEWAKMHLDKLISEIKVAI
jgi:hypothetical protein